MCKAIGYDSSSEPPGFPLGTSWTVRSAMLMYKEEKKEEKKNVCLPYFSSISIILFP